MNRKYEDRNQPQDSDSESDYMYTGEHSATVRHASGGLGSTKDTGLHSLPNSPATSAILLLPIVYSNNRPRSTLLFSPSPKTKFRQSTTSSLTAPSFMCFLKLETPNIAVLLVINLSRQFLLMLIIVYLWSMGSKSLLLCLIMVILVTTILVSCVS